MGFYLSDGEKIVKSWAYSATSNKKSGKNPNQLSLVLTNKRLISIEEGRNILEQEEIPVEKITYIGGSCRSQKNYFLLIMSAFIALLGLVVGIACMANDLAGFSILGWAIFVVGFIMLGLAISKLKSGYFSLVIQLDSLLTDGFRLGVQSLVKKRGVRTGLVKSRAQATYAITDLSVAKSIIAELGGLVADIQKNINSANVAAVSDKDSDSADL